MESGSGASGGPTAGLGPEPRPASPPPGPTRREAARGIAADLRSAGVESPELTAERLLAHALGLERRDLAFAWEERLTPEEALRLARAAARRLAGEPLQHIEGSVAFRELVLTADSRALIPRPETEGLVELAAAWARRRASGRARPVGPGVRPIARPGEEPERPLLGAALEIGTGSGAIALSLAAEGIASRVVATDVSREALRQAEENRSRLAPEVGARVELRLSPGGVWEPLRPGERFDLIISNPPYVSEGAIETLPAEVREHEPRAALAGGPDGLSLIREIVQGSGERLEPGGALFLEIGAEQGRAVRALLEGSPRWRSVSVRRDLAGRERFAVAEAG